MTALEVGSLACACKSRHDRARLIVLTGGPGAGKTAVVQMARRSLCAHVALIPESASIVFGGGFPRHDSQIGKRAAQRAIFHIQRQLETLVIEESESAIALCDRGTIDGMAYWPGATDEYLTQLGITREVELARYARVIHLRTPHVERGYNHANRLRIESAEEAAAIDELIFNAWAGHPDRHVVENELDFLTKATRALDLIRAAMPACCAPAG